MKRRPLLIGVSGYARSGKDTVSQTFIARGFTRVALADSLKKEVARGLGTPFQEFVALLDGCADFKEAVRPILVEWGRFRRRQDPDYWIKIAAALMQGDTVVSDVRYANEAAFIRSLGGFVIGVTRPGIGPANTEEEESLAAFTADAVIANTGTVEELHERAALAFEHLRGDITDAAVEID